MAMVILAADSEWVKQEHLAASSLEWPATVEGFQCFRRRRCEARQRALLLDEPVLASQSRSGTRAKTAAVWHKSRAGYGEEMDGS